MNTLTVGGFSRACIAVLSAAVTLTACGSHEGQRATPEKAVPVSAEPGVDRWTQFATSVSTDAAGKIYMGICLMDLRVPTDAGGDKGPNFDAVALVDDHVVGIITGNSGGEDGRFGIAIVPRGGTGLETVQFNLDTLEANQLLAQQGLCPA